MPYPMSAHGKGGLPEMTWFRYSFAILCSMRKTHRRKNRIVLMFWQFKNAFDCKTSALCRLRWFWFIVGGDEMEVVGRKGKCKEEGIETAYRKWCDYRRTYWKLRGTKDAYPKDYVCEISIPVGENWVYKSVFIMEALRYEGAWIWQQRKPCYFTFAGNDVLLEGQFW